ncbi:integral membrane sensor hybrid histidine kinase [Methylobacterium sp. 4-46]|uniref:ATP-binding protein n=1 Tax=unclassified Methylobacterium TaxID=2615210 RepID=UPI000152EA41|nr:MULTISPECIES: ATP-binding protein [Methylobacterium]ACA16642.1 integral membrane sensor hybrid histidine kinase [Methylobacterium sp. 4-46]WFT82345.1 ATP-binding protein [Methylobacterium nodulans]
MRPVQSSVVWPLRLIAALSLIAPALVFAYAAWSESVAIAARTDERIERALDILQEQALKALQTVERTLAETNEVLRGLDDAAIRADEARLSMRLRQSQEALPQIQAIWAFDAAGHPLVSSTVQPVPRDIDNSDRDYFRAQRDGPAGTFVGEIVRAKLGGYRFFVMSARRPPRPDGGFSGIVAISVLPDHFRQFYTRLARGVADSFGLVRADGAFLARYPYGPDWPDRLTPQSAFLRAVAGAPGEGRLTAVSQIDGAERRIGYRLIPGYPLYVQAGIETAANAAELRDRLLGHLAFGLPATLALFALAVYALRRTERFEAEVSRREIAEAALKQAQRLEAVGQLTGGVAHDFNNLLMVVNGNVERLKRYPVADERQRRALDAIEAAAKRGASLTRQLLSFSRRQTHEPVAVDLAQRLPLCEDMLRSSLRGDIAVELRLAPGLWPTKLDLNELELAVLNLAVNARDAMPGGGRLTIAARNVGAAESAALGLPGEFVALSLSDTGAGIPPDLLSRVFEPFFTTKEVGKGTGLGLSQVYGFARQSGGTATIASEPGRGTTVTLYLPRTAERPEPAEPARGAAAPPGPGQGSGRALLVEDNPEVAEVSRAHLEELGYAVTHARDVASALALLRGMEKVDLVFSDIVMPGDQNGLDLARLVRRERGPRVAVLLATGYSEVARSAASEGFPILRKPFDAPALREAVERARQKASLRVVA